LLLRGSAGSATEQAAEAAAEQRGKSRLQSAGTTRGGGSVGREFVDDEGEDLREAGGGVAVADAGLLGDLLDVVVAEDLGDLVGAYRFVLAVANPGGKDVSQFAAGEFLLQAFDAAVLRDQLQRGLKDGVLF